MGRTGREGGRHGEAGGASGDALRQDGRAQIEVERRQDQVVAAVGDCRRARGRQQHRGQAAQTRARLGMSSASSNREQITVRARESRKVKNGQESERVAELRLHECKHDVEISAETLSDVKSAEEKVDSALAINLSSDFKFLTDSTWRTGSSSGICNNESW